MFRYPHALIYLWQSRSPYVAISKAIEWATYPKPTRQEAENYILYIMKGERK